VVVIAASSLLISGYESRDELNSNEALKTTLESIRLQAGEMMGLGDVRSKPIPKMSIVSRASGGGTINSRTFIPHLCHSSIGVLGAVTVATACALEGSVANNIASMPLGRLMSIEHPTGEFTVELDIRQTPRGPEVVKAALVRTARRLLAGHVAVTMQE
jgi:4-oxalomesaconate tautomerase